MANGTFKFQPSLRVLVSSFSPLPHTQHIGHILRFSIRKISHMPKHSASCCMNQE